MSCEPHCVYDCHYLSAVGWRILVRGIMKSKLKLVWGFDVTGEVIKEKLFFQECLQMGYPQRKGAVKDTNICCCFSRTSK